MYMYMYMYSGVEQLIPESWNGIEQVKSAVSGPILVVSLTEVVVLM